MKKSYILSFWAVLLFSISFSQNIVTNGSFEDELENWDIYDDVYISKYLARDGEYSLGISNSVRGKGFVVQEYEDSIYSFNAFFSVFPQSENYVNTFELVKDWDYQSAEFISLIVLSGDSIRFKSLDADTTIYLKLPLHRWSDFSIICDSTGKEKKYYINDYLICTQKNDTTNYFNYAIIGDLSNSKHYGALHYDKIEIFNTTVKDSTGDFTVTSKLTIEELNKDYEILEQNFPNPFNPVTTIKYNIPSNIKKSPVKVVLKVYNILGDEVTTLVNKYQSQGNYEVVFDASDLASGIYFYKLQTNEISEIKKLVILK
ncbi:MAG: T9SS type A sorting domain-containing protein [Ignavibacteria bacterium]|nr:T9SS type A sorting domain-containing protein [Ignavibacteria bacterium]